MVDVNDVLVMGLRFGVKLSKAAARVIQINVMGDTDATEDEIRLCPADDANPRQFYGTSTYEFMKVDALMRNSLGWKVLSAPIDGDLILQHPRLPVVMRYRKISDARSRSYMERAQ